MERYDAVDGFVESAMTLPALDKSWIYDVNIALPSTGNSMNDHRRLLWTVKNKLISSGQFSVTLSSNSIAAGAADYWPSIASLIWNDAGAAHSWVVLKRTALPCYEVLIDLGVYSGASVPDRCNAWVSLAGFTGGSTTTPPTATDQSVLRGQDGSVVMDPFNWTGAGIIYPPAFSCALHYMYSSDGRSQRLFMFKANACNMFIDFQEPKNPVTGWTSPWVATWAISPNYAHLNDAWCGSAIHNGGPWMFYLGTEGYVAGAIGERQTVSANELDSAYPMTPATIVSSYSGYRGRHGVMNDLWFGPTQLNEGDMFPADNSKQFVMIGDVITPWAGVNILLA